VRWREHDMGQCKPIIAVNLFRLQTIITPRGAPIASAVDMPL